MNRKVSVAPMMDRTDRHCRYFFRQLSKKSLLYTEMITADAIINGDRKKLLSFSDEEHPLALQIGGSNPDTLAEATKIGLVDRPLDLKGYNLFVDNSAKIGDYSKAHLAQNHIIEKIKQTVSADDYGKLAELMIGATNGYPLLSTNIILKLSLFYYLKL